LSINVLKCEFKTAVSACYSRSTESAESLYTFAYDKSHSTSLHSITVGHFVSEI